MAALVRHELRHQELKETPGEDYDRDGLRDAMESNDAFSPWTHALVRNTYNLSVELFYRDLNEWLKEGTPQQQEDRKKQIESHRWQLDKFGDNELLASVAEGRKQADEGRNWAFPGSQAKER